MIVALLSRPAPVDPDRLAADLVGGGAAQEDDEVADLGGRHELRARAASRRAARCRAWSKRLALGLGPGLDLGLDQRA